MKYRINVAKLEKLNDRMSHVYVFHTIQDGIYSAQRAYYEIKDKFPGSQYSVTFEVWEYSGKEVDADEYFSKNS